MSHWRRLSIRVVPMVALSVTLLVACAPALNWREVRLADAHGLQAVFPCKPDVAERRLALPGMPRPVTLHLLSCQADGAMWALSYLKVSEVALVPVALRALADATRQNVQAASEPSSLRAVELAPVAVARMTPQPDARAWRFEALRPGDDVGQSVPMVVTTWHFSHGLTVFQGAVWQRGEGAATPSGVHSGREAENTFFQGFHFPA